MVSPSFFLFVNFLMNFGDHQLKISLFLFLFIIKLLISFKELIFVQLFRFFNNLVLHSGSFHKHFLNSFVSELDFLLHNSFDLLCAFNHLGRHLLGFRRILSHHDLYILVLFILQHSSPLAGEILVCLLFDFIIFKICFFLYFTNALFLSFSLSFSFLAILFLLSY